MKKLNELINQANIELDEVMPKFLDKMLEIQNILKDNKKGNPIVIGSKEDNLIMDTRDMWLDMSLAWPLIKFRDPDMFYNINDFFFDEQPPMGLKQDACRKVVESISKRD